MNRKFLLISGCSIILLAFIAKAKLDIAKNFRVIEGHLWNSASSLTDTLQFPRTTSPDGKLKAVPSNDWTSGFYASNLWYMYELTKHKKWQQAAMRWTAAL